MTSYAFLGAPRTSQDLLGPQFPCRILLKIIVEIKDIQEILDTRQPWTRQRHQGRRVSRREAYPPGLRRSPPGNLLESGSALSGRAPGLRRPPGNLESLWERPLSWRGPELLF